MDADRQKLLDELERLRSENAELKTAVAALTRQVEELTKRNEKLSAALEAARRAGKRQAAPFRKKSKRQNPKKPGRKPGDQYGKHARAAVPTPEQITERYDVPLPEACDSCQCTEIEAGEPVVQYQVEIPQNPIYRKFTIAKGRCKRCRKTVRGRHDLQTSDATGAASVQLGPRAHAAFAWLNKRLGLSHGKIRQAFGELFGISISRSTAARSCHRTAKRCATAREEVTAAVCGSAQVVPDETGWRVCGKKAWLHAFVGLNEVLYVIDPTRSGKPAEQVLGLDWSGHLVHDGWSPYDSFTQAVHQQCNAHLINRCNEMLETATSSAAQFPAAIKDLLQRGLALRDRYLQHKVSEHGLLVMAGRLTNELLYLVGVRKKNPDNERFAKFLFHHHESIFNYLRHPGMDATNWRGEHGIRFGVVNRKVWGGNRTWPGSDTQETLMSVMETCVMRHFSPMQFLVNTLTAATPPPLPPLALER